MSVTPFTSVSSDYSGGFRLDETMSGGDNRYLHVLSIDGAASSVTAAVEKRTAAMIARVT